MRQRTPPDPDHLHPVAPWSPDRLTPAASVAASFTPGVARSAPVPDWYVVVDELDELGCRLAVDAWPDTDGDGRLVFADGEQLVSVAPDRLHAAISAARLRRGDEAPERPLRIGDTFAWWSGPLARDLLGLGPPGGVGDRPEGRGLEVVDVTRDARRLTKVAALATGGGVLAADEIARLGLAEADGDSGGGAP